MRSSHAILLAATLLLAAPEPSAAEGRILIHSETLVVPEKSAPVMGAASPAFAGGLRIHSDDPAFGGYSGLCIEPDGGKLLAISDRGTWLELELIYGADGRLLRAGEATLGRLTGENGKPLLYRDTDAEAMTCQPDRSIILAFERNHRLLHYPPAARPFSRPPVRVAGPPGVEKLPVNAGIEAIGHFGDGVLVAISEMMSPDQNLHLGWIGRAGAWERFGYAPRPGFRVTDATVTATGDLLVLEHHYNPILGHLARLARIPRLALKPGQRVEGSELLVLGPSAISASFEGLAVRRGRDGREFLYLISDNNFNPAARTIILMFSFSSSNGSPGPRE